MKEDASFACRKRSRKIFPSPARRGKGEVCSRARAFVRREGVERAVSEAEQSAQILEAIEAVEGWDWAGPILLYSHRDHKDAPNDFQANFGLMRHDSSPKQAWVDLLALAARP